MIELFKASPDADVVLALEPHKLGLLLLSLIKNRAVNGSEEISRHNCINDVRFSDASRGISGYPREKWPELELAISEAFSWLESCGLLLPQPRQTQGSWMVLSRRARTITSTEDYERLALSEMLRTEFLHPLLRDGVRSSFIRGELDVAIFQAMKQVEVRVREASKQAASEYGVAMARQAFHKETGPLRDPRQADSEREALMHIFAGAIGSYKNPHSHRNVAMEDPTEAAEIIVLARHLLKIIDARERLSESANSPSQ